MTLRHAHIEGYSARNGVVWPLIVKLAIKAMLDFVAQCGPLVFSICSGIRRRVWCPDVANAIHHSIVAVGVAISCGLSGDLSKKMCFPVQLMPDDLDAVLRRGRAPRENKQQQKRVFHIHSCRLVEA